MSVINQMLKDLDQRQHEQQKRTHAKVETVIPSSRSIKVWLIIAITMVCTLVIIYGSYLFYQNQRLTESLARQEIPVKKATARPSSTLLVKQTKVVNEKVVNEKVTEKAVLVVEKNEMPSLKISPIRASETVNNLAANKSIAIQPSIENAKKQIAKKQNANIKSAKINVVQHKSTKIAAQKVEPLATPLIVDNKPKSSMSVSRRKISPEQLAQQKMAQAQEALLNDDVAKAELLFEDILILSPNNKAVRKQLAALWFGRQSYQPALNLLSQGIALDEQDSEFRLMQARIYLSQGAKEKARQVLQSYEQTDDVEYLVTLASIAQQLGKYQQAVESYQHLTRIQPAQARWWLGIAVAYDSNGQYKLAAQAYQSAVAQGNLSSDSQQFAQQRIHELGE